MTAFDDLLDAYTPMLKSIVWKFGAGHIRSECLQEARIGLLEAYKNHRIDAEAFTGIAYAEARKRVIRCTQKLGNAIQFPEGTVPVEDGPMPVDETAGGPTPDAQLSQARASRLLKERIAELTRLMSHHEAEAIALMLGPVQPPRWAEAATRLGTTVAALTVARRRAERRLAKGIPAELVTELIGDA